MPRLEHRDLPLDSKDAAVDERLSKQIGGVAQQVTRAKRVRAVHDDIEPRQQVQCVALVDGRLDRFHGQLRVQPAERLRRNLHLWLVEAVDRMNHLPLQVREANAVVIGQPDGAHAGSGEIERCG